MEKKRTKTSNCSSYIHRSELLGFVGAFPTKAAVCFVICIIFALDNDDDDDTGTLL